MGAFMPYAIFLASTGLANIDPSVLAFAAGFIAGVLIGAAISSNRSAFEIVVVIGGFFILYLLLIEGAAATEDTLVEQLLDLFSASVPFVFGLAVGLFFMADNIRDVASSERR